MERTLAVLAPYAARGVPVVELLLPSRVEAADPALDGGLRLGEPEEERLALFEIAGGLPRRAVLAAHERAVAVQPLCAAGDILAEPEIAAELIEAHARAHAGIPSLERGEVCAQPAEKLVEALGRDIIQVPAQFVVHVACLVRIVSSACV